MPKFFIESQIVMTLPEELRFLEDGDEYRFIASKTDDFALLTKENYDKALKLDGEPSAKALMNNWLSSSYQVSVKNHKLILPMILLPKFSEIDEQEFTIKMYSNTIRIFKGEELSNHEI